MNIWDILGISETKDVEKLKIAYRNQLKTTNPEDDPQGFMELRKAYEEALKLASVSEEETSDEEIQCSDELKDLFQQLQEIYNDFDQRIDEQKWVSLFDRDEFVSLDTSSDALDLLLRFLMVYYYLPKNIWRIINDTFYIDEKRKELSEKYPREFIEYIICNSKYDDILNYYLFDGDASLFDTFIRKYYRLDELIRHRKTDKTDKLIEELEEMDVYHPYLLMCKLRCGIQKLNGEKNEEIIEEIFADAMLLCEEFPDDILINTNCGDIALFNEDYENAKIYYEKANELNPDSYIVKSKMADIAFHLGEFVKSRDLYMDLLKINNYDNNVRAGMVRANQSIIDDIKQKLKDDPDNIELKLEMSWSYYQSFSFKEAVNLLESFEPTEDKVFEYNNVKGRSYLCILEYDKALECFFKWKESIENLPDDDTEDVLSKKKRYEYVNFLIGDCYLKLGQYEKAKEYIDRALSKDHEEIILSYEANCELMYKRKEYDECIKACEKLLEYGERNYIAYEYMAKAYDKLDYVKETLIACERAINVYPYVADPYVKEIDLYLRFNQIDDAQNVLKRYLKLDIESDKITHKKASILIYEKKYEKALAILSELSVKCKLYQDETDIDSLEYVYYDIGFCCEKMGRYQETITAYEQVIEINPENPRIYGKLAYVYHKLHKYKTAIELYTTQIEVNPNLFYFMQRGVAYSSLGQYHKAIEDLTNVVSTEKNSFCFKTLGWLYEAIDEPGKSLEAYKTALDMEGEESSEDEKTSLIIACGRLSMCMGDMEQAYIYLHNGIESLKPSAKLLTEYAHVLQRMGKLEEAFKVLKDYCRVASDKERHNALISLLKLYCDEGYLDLANETFRTILSIYPESLRAYDYITTALMEYGRMDDARVLLETAYALDVSKHINFASKLAFIFAKENTFFKKNKEYSKYLHEAITKNGEAVVCRVYHEKAKLCRLQKRYKEALNLVEAGMRSTKCEDCHYGSCHELLYEKGLIYEAMKEYDKARQCYLEALKIKGHCELYSRCLKRIEGK